MLALGTAAPDFRLPDTGGKMVALGDFTSAPALAVFFICNHCPFVKHIQAGLVQLARDYQARGAAIVAISANDAQNYPEDSPAKMAKEAKSAGYTFPYLYDESQAVAKAYQAACTPDIFLFDKNRKLIPANRWPVFEERTFRSRRSDLPEPREALVTDVTGDGKNDLVVLVHDRILVYPQE